MTTKPTAQRIANARVTGSGRGRPPARAFINVLVRKTTRATLTRLRREWKLASQGEVIDRLINEAR